MSALKTHSSPDAERLQMGWRVHPEIRKALKIAAAHDGVTMEEKLHVILCEALGLSDLLSDHGNA